MADIYSKEKRSKIMAAIPGRETGSEIAVRRHLFALGFRYRKNVARMPGTPDIVLPKYKTIIFIHGCFWHGHDQCKKGARPTSNVEFWNKKIQSNIERDHRNMLELERNGWNVIVLWECQLRNRSLFKETLDTAVKQLKQV